MFNSNFIKNRLLMSIDEMAQNKAAFTKEPEKNFSRNRKLGFRQLVRFILSLEGGSMNKEILNYFDFSADAPSNSAFCQQRSKLLPETFKFLLNSFNSVFPFSNTYKGFRLIACDGSNLNIARNPKDKDTYIQSRSNALGFNQMHLNALFDVCNGRFTDILIQSAHEKNEISAMTDMIKRFNSDEKTVFIADRGYESYNVFAHIQEKHLYYLIRVKDINSNGIVSSLKFPYENEFDRRVNIKLTRNQTKEVLNNPSVYKYIPSSNKFSFLPLIEKSKKEVLKKIKYYEMIFRVVRVCIKDGKYECFITNLPEDVFPPEEIKKIYGMRWETETSFRVLKYSVGLDCFHSKKAEFIRQEIYARVIMFNFYELVMSCVTVPEKKGKYPYKINVTTAVYICRMFFRANKFPPDVEKLISMNLQPVRPGRSSPRKVRFQTWNNFLYRIY